MSTLNREQLLGKRPRTESVELPDGDTVLIREWTPKQRQEIEGGEFWMENAVAASVIDDTGALVFSPEDVPAIHSAMGNSFILTIYNAAVRLNKAHDVKTLAKNSESSPDSTTPTK